MALEKKFDCVSGTSAGSQERRASSFDERSNKRLALREQGGESIGGLPVRTDMRPTYAKT